MSPSVTSGLAGGLLATIVATGVFTLAGRDRPLPAARLWATYVLDDGQPGDAVWPGLGIHTIAGTVAGGAFAVLLGATTDPAGTVALLPSLAWGIGYGLLLFVGHVGGVLQTALGVRIDRELLAEFLVLHVIYDTVLGVWTGFDLLSAL